MKVSKHPPMWWATGFAWLTLLPNLLFTFGLPLGISFGGQWAAPKQGTTTTFPFRADYRFFERSQLFPVDCVVYVILYVGVCYLFWKSAQKVLNWEIVLKYFALLNCLPSAWLITTLFVGFREDYCHRPSEAFSCNDPTRMVIGRIGFNIGLFVFGYFCIWQINRLQKKAKTPSLK